MVLRRSGLGGNASFTLRFCPQNQLPLSLPPAVLVGDGSLGLGAHVSRAAGMMEREDTTLRGRWFKSVTQSTLLSAVPRPVRAPPLAHALEGGHATWEKVINDMVARNCHWSCDQTHLSPQGRGGESGVRRPAVRAPYPHGFPSIHFLASRSDTKGR